MQTKKPNRKQHCRRMTNVSIFTSLWFCLHFQTAVTSEARTMVGSLPWRLRAHKLLTQTWNEEFGIYQMYVFEDCGNKVQKFHAGTSGTWKLDIGSEPGPSRYGTTALLWHPRGLCADFLPLHLLLKHDSSRELTETYLSWLLFTVNLRFLLSIIDNKVEFVP